MDRATCFAAPFLITLLSKKYLDIDGFKFSDNDSENRSITFICRGLLLVPYAMIGVILKTEKVIPSFTLFLTGYLGAFILYDYLKKLTLPKISLSR